VLEKQHKPKPRAGFVAIIGRPNAGKSTLLNRYVGQKVAIVSSKPQTTRNRIQGIVTRPEGQIVFIDTPGLHEGDTLLNRQMMREVAAALEGIDVLLMMVDASRTLPHADSLLLEKGQRFPGKTILVLNKIDRVPKPKLLPLIDVFAKAFSQLPSARSEEGKHPASASDRHSEPVAQALRPEESAVPHGFAAIVPTSALKGDGCQQLLQEILKNLPEGEPFFPQDEITDQPERFLVSEIIREKAIDLTYHEVPHALAVVVEKFEEEPNILRIHATLNVERDSQKKILIGHKGEMLKKVGTRARQELESLLGTKIFLSMFVKVAPGWREIPAKIRELDWRTQLESLAEDQQKKTDQS
jgi:GTP-binding protein Era